jgi:membrane protease YdiL (CAAX protease family)
MKASASEATGGRRGAAVDLAIWLGVVALVAVGANLFLRGASLGGLLARIAVPAQMIALFALATTLLYRRGERWRSVGLRAPVSLRRVAGLVAAGYLAVAVMNALLVLLVLPKAGIARPAFGAFSELKGHPWTFAYWLVFAWISAGIGEELQFRGFLWSRLERLFGPGRAGAIATLFTQAVLFGLCHLYQGLGGVLATGAAGLALGGVFLAGRRNLVACMVLHGLIDTVSLTVLFLGLIPAGLTR